MDQKVTETHDEYIDDFGSESVTKEKSIAEEVDEIQSRSPFQTALYKVRNYVLDFDDEGGTKKFKAKKVFTWGALLSFLLVVPAFAFNLIFDWFPMFTGIRNAFYSWTTGTNPIFVGFNNFVRVFTDSMFYHSLRNMLFFFAANLILLIPTVVCSIVLFHLKSSKAQYVYRVLLCLQLVVPGIVTTLMWFFMLNVSYGAINVLLQNLGFDSVAFLSDPKLIKWTVVGVSIPWVSANDALIYLGGLNSIDEAVWDAGKLDGVGPIKRLVKLELPLILGQFKLVLMGVLSNSIIGYGTQLLYYNAAVHDSIMVPGLLMYLKAFPMQGGNPDYGYSFALGMILFIVSLLISIFTLKFFKTKND